MSLELACFYGSGGRVYSCFTLEDALAMLGCGKDKAVRLFKELGKSGGIGLIAASRARVNRRGFM